MKITEDKYLALIEIARTAELLLISSAGKPAYNIAFGEAWNETDDAIEAYKKIRAS